LIANLPGSIVAQKCPTGAKKDRWFTPNELVIFHPVWPLLFLAKPEKQTVARKPPLNVSI